MYDLRYFNTHSRNVMLHRISFILFAFCFNFQILILRHSSLCCLINRIITKWQCRIKIKRNSHILNFYWIEVAKQEKWKNSSQKLIIVDNNSSKRVSQQESFKFSYIFYFLCMGIPRWNTSNKLITLVYYEGL